MTIALRLSIDNSHLGHIRQTFLASLPEYGILVHPQWYHHTCNLLAWFAYCHCSYTNIGNSLYDETVRKRVKVKVVQTWDNSLWTCHLTSQHFSLQWSLWAVGCGRWSQQDSSTLLPLPSNWSVLSQLIWAILCPLPQAAEHCTSIFVRKLKSGLDFKSHISIMNGPFATGCYWTAFVINLFHKVQRTASVATWVSMVTCDTFSSTSAMAWAALASNTL